MILSASAFSAVSFSIHLESVLLAAARCRSQPGEQHPEHDSPAVSVVRPVCGTETWSEETLRSTFELDYPRYEVLFCAAKGQDPILPLIERLIAAYPHVRARILIGDDRISANPKLNNFAKGWRAASFPWIVVADSNVLMPRDYIQRLLSAWQPGTGLVCSPPVGSRAGNVWAELECAFLNTYQARWQYFADALGLGFAQGKTMLWRREVLECSGGIEALGMELAEDAASTKVVRRLGLRVRLVERPFEQPLGKRQLTEIWNRQLRWARLRRASFKAYFIPEVLTGGLAPILIGAICAGAHGFSAIAAAALLATIWYGAEASLAIASGWHISLRAPLIWALRDLMVPLLWAQACIDSPFVWRGNEMQIAPAASAPR